MGTEKLLIKLSKKCSLSYLFSERFFLYWSLCPKEKEYNKSTIYSLLGYGILIESTKKHSKNRQYLVVLCSQLNKQKGGVQYQLTKKIHDFFHQEVLYFLVFSAAENSKNCGKLSHEWNRLMLSSPTRLWRRKLLGF